MTPELHALTLLMLLCHAAVPHPPLLDRWCEVTSGELSDLHLVIAAAIFGDLSSVQTLLLSKQSYDWSSLRVAHGVLKGMWRQYLRKNIPLLICVLTCVWTC